MAVGWLQTLVGARNDGHHLVIAAVGLAVSGYFAAKVVSMLAVLLRDGTRVLARDQWKLVVEVFAFFLLMTFFFGWDLVLDPSTSPQRWLVRNGLLAAGLLSVFGLNVFVTAAILLVDGVRRLRKRPGQTGSL